MPKIEIFLWQLLHNALPVRGVLVRWGLNIDPACSLCMNDVESNDCLFWECPCIKEMWNLAQHHRWLLLPEIQYGPRCSKNLLFQCKQSRNKEDVVKVAYLLWHIWKERNAFIFQREIFGPLRTLIRAKRSYAEWGIRTCMPGGYSRGLLHRRSVSNFIVRWSAPLQESSN